MSQASTEKPRVRLGYGGGGLTGETAGEAGSTTIRLLRYAWPYKWALTGVALLVLISTLAALAGPILLGMAVDEAIVTGDRAGLLRISLWMAGLYLAGALASVGHGMIMVTVGQGLVADIRFQLFSHVQELSMAYHDRHQVGDLMSRISNDTEAINQVLSNGLIQFVTNVLMLGGTLVAMFLLNWQLSIGALILLPVMVIVTSQVTKLSRKAFRDMQRNLGGLNAVMEEHISGIRVVQAFARSADAQEKFRQVNGNYREAGITADIISAALGPMFTTMSTITIAATALLGGWLALRGDVTVGIIATFVVYIMNFFRPMRSIAMLYNHLQSALAGAERIFDVLDTPQPVEQDDGIAPLHEIEGEVSFEQVTFGYDPSKPVLSAVSLEAKPGQTIALVGPTGAGKTTIISLLSRFYDVDEGRITIDGRDIRQVRQKQIRSQLGIVLQDTFLFSGTVADNIRYGRLDASDEEVRAAAALANADWFIRRLPNGYNTQVSEQGHNFSQGQRQLLSIARAALADPRILILDEATSSVDTRTEMQIQQALLRLMSGRTAFVIAHRLSTIRQADKVIVIDHGRVMEEGTHHELLRKRGVYHDMYMSQYRHLAPSST